MNKRLLGLVVGAAAMALTQMTPAHAGTGSGSQGYVGGLTAFGTGFNITPGGTVPGAPGIGGVTFNGVTGATVNIKIADATGRGQAAHVSFRGASDPTKPFTEVGSGYICGESNKTFTYPASATRVVIFLESASTDNATLTPGDCATGKYGPPTTGTITLTAI